MVSTVENGNREAPAEEASVGGMLQFLGAGANAPILMTLAPRALRTKELTQKMPALAPRTVYRHVQKLGELRLIDRQETEGVPSFVIQSLSVPVGHELVQLLDRYATVTQPRYAAPHDGNGLWTSLGLIGQMWSSGWIRELSSAGRSATDLSEATADMTFHQVTRRLQQLMSWNLVSKSDKKKRQKRYQLTDRARQGMAMVAGVARWRQRYVARAVGVSLTVPEAAVLLRTCLPLVDASDYPGMSIKLGVVAAPGQNGGQAPETLSAVVGASGALRIVRDRAKPDSWMLCTVDGWIAALVEGDLERIRAGGDLDFAGHCLEQLQEVLWGAPVEMAAG